MTNIGHDSEASNENIKVWNNTNKIEQPATSETAPTTSAPQSFQDGLGSLGLEKTAPDYLYGAASPHLPQASTDLDTGNFEWIGLSKDIAKHLEKKSEAPSDAKNVMDEIDKAIAKLFGEDSEKLVSKFGGMTQEQIDTKLKYSYFHPDEKNPSDPIQQMTKMVAENVKEAMKNEGKGNVQEMSPEMQMQEFDQQVQLTYANKFSLLLEQHDAPLQDKQAVEFALYNPEAKESLTTEQKNLFNQLSAESMQAVSQRYGVPLDELPDVNKESAYNIRLNLNYGENYIAALQALKADGTITEKEFKALQANLYYPGSVPLDEKMKGIEGKLQQEVFAAFVQENGIPPNWKPTVPSNQYDAWGNGLYRDNFKALVANAQPPLDPATQQQLLKAMQDPTSVPAAIQQLFQQMDKKALEMTIATIGLPAVWQPTSTVINPNLSPQMASTLEGAKAFLKESGDIQQGLFTQLMQTPEGKMGAVTFMNYLKIVGEALDQMQQLIYAIESADAKISKLLNSITLDMQMNKIDKMKREAEERKQQEEAGKSGFKGFLNSICEILGPLIAIVTIIAAIALTLLPPMSVLALPFLAIAVGSLTCTTAKAAGYDMMKEGFKAMDDLIAALIPKSGLREACQIITRALMIAIVLLTCSTAGLGGVLLAMQVGMDMLMESDIIGRTVKACGGDAQAQMIANMVVMATVMVAIAAVMLVASAALLLLAPAGVAAGAVAAGSATAQAATQAGTVAANSARAGAQLAGAMAQLTSRTIAQAGTTARVVQGVQNAATNASRISGQLIRDLADGVKNFIAGFKDPKIALLRLSSIASGVQQASQSGLQAAKAGSDMVLYTELAELAIKIANLKADQQEIDGLIKALKKIIEQLMAELSGLSEFVKSINQLQVKKFKDASMTFVTA